MGGVIAVTSAREMRDATLAEAADADAVVMAAAVAYFRPEVRSEAKIKKDGSLKPAPIVLIQNPYILAELLLARRAAPACRPYLLHDAAAAPGTSPQGQVIVGFAAETQPDLSGSRGQPAP